MKRVAIYVRVSTLEQTEGYSIPEQTDRLNKYCEAHGWLVVKTYTDPGYSGANMDRPALQQLFADANKAVFDTVLVYKLDRLSRSQKDTLYIIEDVLLAKQISFISMSESFDTSTPFGRAMIGILSVFAQLEREQIKERLAMGQLGRAKAGYWRAGSNVPTGYDYIDGKLVINEYEAMQIRKIYELFLQGESIYAISQYMNKNYTNRYSSYKDAGQVGVMLRNKLYIGMVKYNDEEFQGLHEPIIDMDTWNKVQKRYKEISEKWSDNYRSPYKGKHLLTGLLYCGTCGARYFCWCSRGKKNKEGKRPKLGEKYSYYKCYSRDKNSTMKKADFCDNPNFRVEQLDAVILNEIEKIYLDSDYLESLVTKPQIKKANSEMKALEDKKKDIESKISKLVELYTLGAIPLELIGEKVQSLTDEKKKIEEQIQKTLDAEKEPGTLSLQEVQEVLKDIDNIHNMPLQEQREIVKSLIQKVVVEHDKSITIHWKF